MSAIRYKCIKSCILAVTKRKLNGPKLLVPICRHKSSVTQADDDAEHLHHSIVPTDHFQYSLPRLPIPPLDKTIERYLKCVKQILSPEEFSNTQRIAETFSMMKGIDLHEELVKLDMKNKHTSYVSGPWFDMYLKSRLPIVLHYNPFMTFTDDPRPEYQNQLIRATNMVVSSLRFLKTLRAGILEPDVYHLNPKMSDTEQFRKFVRMLPKSVSFYGAYWYKAFPLDMSQYARLFNSTRIPRHERDELFTDETAKHLLVMRNGHFYIFDVFDKNGMIVKPEIIMSHIQYILQDNRPPPEYPLGVLTSMERDQWATTREQLLNAGNEITLKKIDSAVFCLNLDDITPTDPNAVTRQFLHGDGVNRWFDKSFQLILTPDGKACVNFEHAWGDGVAVLRYFNEVFKDSTTKSRVHPSTKPDPVDSSQVVQHLDIKLDPYLKETIQKAKGDFDRTMATLDLHYLEYNKYTKKYVKAKGFSPDALMQLVIQMAYYRQKGKTVATYESCSTAAFKHGRTETIRPATFETKVCCHYFVTKQKKDLAQMESSLRQCSAVHTQLTKEAAMGQGFDRHLFGLKNIAEKRGKKYDIFEDPTYAKINHNILSTSTISSPAVLIGGFAPVVPDGYGIGYSIEDSRIGFNVTSYPPDTNVRDFILCLEESLDAIYEVFEGRLPKS